MIFYCNGKKDYCDCSILCQDCKANDNSGGKWSVTNAERLRSMDDTQLAQVILKVLSGGSFCQKKKECETMLDQDKEIPDEWCIRCVLEWLHKPCEERPSWLGEDRQESGLLEEY